MSVSIMLKPASSACNLKCEYCFYSKLADSRSKYFYGMMSNDTAQSVVRSAFDLSSDACFTFQGGEPLLRGIDFFENFITLVDKHKKADSKITLCVQTNATLIDEKWCAFFKKNNVLLGVSLDGDQSLNSYRKYPDGSDSFGDVLCGIDLLKKYKVKFNILSVLTSRTAKKFRQSYRFFKDNSLNYIQYIPCLGDSDREDNKYVMSCDDYANYLVSAYKLYYNRLLSGDEFSIRQFDNYIALAHGGYAEQCGMNGFCSEQFVVEGDGSVFPCDFYCTDEWLMGNINSRSFREIRNDKKYKNFISQSCIHRSECKDCKYFSICRGGGCKRNRANADYCSAYKKFFSQAKLL